MITVIEKNRIIMYNIDIDISLETAFEDIPDDWVCPICGLGKDVFVPVED